LTSIDQAVQRIKPLVRHVVDMYATPLTAAHYVELVNPLWSGRHLQARVIAVIDETADARTIVLRPGRNWRRHRAGQHMRIGLSVDGRRYTRTYTLSSSPERPDGDISITTKILPGGRMSEQIVRRLQVGDYLPIGLPQGDFVLPEGRPVKPLFITAGSGITPVMSMLRTYDLISNIPDTTHIHYAPHAYDVIFGNELAGLADRHSGYYDLHVVHTRDGGDGPSSDRHFSAEQLELLCPDWREREIWACGPQQLLDSVEAHFEAAGMGRRFHTERFRAALIEFEDVQGGTVTFQLPDGSSTTADTDGASPLLRVAEDNGLNPPHGCRMGICHTCDSVLGSGRVRDLRNARVIDEPGDTVQTCVAAPLGDCTILMSAPAS
jgi:ferredoxin-NADP reductase